MQKPTKICLLLPTESGHSKNTLLAPLYTSTPELTLAWPWKKQVISKTSSKRSKDLHFPHIAYNVI